MGRLNPRQSITTNVPECSSLQLSIPTSPQTTPPYSLIVYPVGGPPSSVYPLTLSGQNVHWTVDYPESSELILSLVDSKGNAVGYPELYQVQNGTTACLPSPPRPSDSPIRVVTDTTTDPKPCSAITMYYSGGQKPYTVTILPLRVAAAYNITLGTNDDAISWIDTLPPSLTFFAVASDSQGVTGAPKYFLNDNTPVTPNNTTGGTDISCPGQVTRPFSSGGSTSNSINSNTTTADTYSGTHATNGNNQNNEARTAAIVGGVVGATLLLGLLFIFFRRKVKSGKGRYNRPGFEDEPAPGFSATGGSMVREGYAILTPFLNPSDANTSSSRGRAGVAGETMVSTSQKGVQQRDEPTSHTTKRDQQVHEQMPEHQEADGVIELPPAYRDIPTH